MSFFEQSSLNPLSVFSASNCQWRSKRVPNSARKVLALLEGKRFALFVDDDKTDPVIVAVGIRDLATFELAIPQRSYDGLALMEFIDKHYGEKMPILKNDSFVISYQRCISGNRKLATGPTRSGAAAYDQSGRA